MAINMDATPTRLIIYYSPNQIGVGYSLNNNKILSLFTSSFDSPSQTRAIFITHHLRIPSQYDMPLEEDENIAGLKIANGWLNEDSWFLYVQDISGQRFYIDYGQRTYWINAKLNYGTCYLDAHTLIRQLQEMK